MLQVTMLWAVATLSLAAELSNEAPNTVYWEATHLATTKKKIAATGLTAADHDVQKCLAKLRRNADLALQRGPFSVMEKQDIPPSGDKHDYLSYSRYWWPNPDTDDGLPYVRRDGQTNVAMRARGDRDSLGLLVNDVETLALAYFYFEDDSYALHAGKLIRTWFLDPTTRMNPHLNYGQAVLGRSDGRDVGIIDTRGFILILDATALLHHSKHFTEEEAQELRKWFTAFLDWLLTSELGMEESAAKNNHGSWYAAQVARIALFTGQKEVARQIVEGVETRLIPAQFRANGSQPEELGRTRSLHYSFFNLAALCTVARVGEHLDMDLWNDRLAESSRMRAGIDFVAPRTIAQRDWPYPQLGAYELSPQTIQLLRMASTRYGQQAYLDVIERVNHSRTKNDYSLLQFSALK